MRPDSLFLGNRWKPSSKTPPSPRCRYSKTALGTTVDLTVFRKLSALPYRTSYSHRGAYYTLDTLAHYDELGLWSYRDIHFSRHGTLLNTAATLVTEAPAGYFTDELEAVVHVAAKDALRQLVQQGRLDRRELEGRYLYCAAERGRRQEQWAARQAQQRPEDELAGRHGPLLQSAGRTATPTLRRAGKPGVGPWWRSTHGPVVWLGRGHRRPRASWSC